MRNLKFDMMGKVFVLVVACVLFPAYGLSLSLLFLMASIFTAILIYNLIHVWFNLRGITMTLENIPDLYAGQSSLLPITITNRNQFFSSNFIEVSMIAGEQEFSTRLMKLKPGNTQELHLNWEPPTRGWLTIERFRCGSGYPFGMFHHFLEIKMKNQVLVYPGLLNQLPALLSSEEKGTGQTPISSGDYQYLSTYQPGDDVRLIHWRRSTLLEEPVIRKDLMAAQRSQPRLFVPDACPNFEYAISAMATWFASNEFSGWAIYSEEGAKPLVSWDDAMSVLALVQPLNGSPDRDSIFELGYSPLYASQLCPEA